MTDSLSYCTREVKRLDHERYLASLFASDAKRPALMALYAFNLEIAKIPEIVSEPTLGQIRLQWWREAIEEIYTSAPRAHAVTKALFGVIQENALSRNRLERIIDTRARDLDPTEFSDLPALEDYIAGTAGELCALSLEVLEVADNDGLAAAYHAGLAWGLSGLLRALPFHARQQRLYVPRSCLDGAGVSREQVFSGNPPASLDGAIRPIVAAARSHLAFVGSFPRGSARAAFLPLVLAQVYLDRLESHGFDVFAPGLEQGALGRQLRLAWAALRSR